MKKKMKKEKVKKKMIWFFSHPDRSRMIVSPGAYQAYAKQIQVAMHSCHSAVNYHFIISMGLVVVDKTELGPDLSDSREKTAKTQKFATVKRKDGDVFLARL